MHYPGGGVVCIWQGHPPTSSSLLTEIELRHILELSKCLSLPCLRRGKTVELSLSNAAHHMVSRAI